MEHMITEILKQHGIEDEKLANALAEIIPFAVDEALQKKENSSKVSDYFRGIR